MRRLALWTVCVLTLGAIAAAVASESFSGSLLIRPSWTHTSEGVTTGSESFDTLLSWTHTNGDTTNQMNQVWVSRRSLASNASEVIDIDGAITNIFGTVLTVAEVRFFAVVSASTNTTAIAVGNAPSTAFATWVRSSDDSVIVRPGGALVLVAPDATAYAVSGNGNIGITNLGASAVAYDVWIGGSDN